MNTTSTSHRWAGPSARDLRWQRGLRLALIAAVLSGAPMLARTATAQRPATIQASAYVIDSYIATGLRPDADTATTAASALPTEALPASRQLRIAGLGVLDVRSGSGTEIRVASRVTADRGTSGTTLQVSVSYLGN
jgi:hypothetical protein